MQKAQRMIQGNTTSKGAFGRLFKMLLSEYKVQLIIVLICLILSIIGNLTSSVFVKNITDVLGRHLISRTSPWDELIPLFVIMGIIYIVGLFANFFYNLIMAIVTQKFLNSLRIKLFDHMETLPIRYFDTHLHGDVMSIYTNDVDTIRMLVSQSIPSIFQNSITVLSLLVIMLSYSFFHTFFVIYGSLLMYKISGGLTKSMRKYFGMQQRSVGIVEGNIEETINGLKVIKVFNHEQKSIDDFDKINNELCEVSCIANRNGNVMGPITGNIGNLMYVALAALGCVMMVRGGTYPTLFGWKEMTYGTLISFLTMVRMFTGNVNNFSMQIIHIMMGVAGAQRIFDVLDSESEDRSGRVHLVFAKKNELGEVVKADHRTRDYAWEHHHLDGTITYHELKGDIVFKDVDFSYVEGKPILHKINIYAEPGQKIALVGATGAGKTTITNLINRFYEINDGKIYYDGINITKINKDDLRKSLGIVLQETNLFTGTVMDNIRYGRLDATDEECIEAAKIANAHDFITRLPQGYNTLLEGDGANLSQGQRQLLSIARAAVADAPVMVLDEATSSIDTRTEKLVSEGMDHLMENRTVFVIAHRLSTVRNSDAIMVIDDGKIIERGTHESLMAKQGRYYKLYTGAFELD